MSIQPKNIQSSAGPEVFVPPYIVSEDIAVVILTMAALAVVSYIESAGAAIKKHVPGILFESWFGVVVADDKFRMRPYLSCISASGLAAKTLGRCSNSLGIDIVY